MTKLITADGCFVAFASAIGYGLGYAIPAHYGLNPLLCILICLTLGSLPGTLAGKAVFSRYVQEKLSRRVISFIVILLVFAVAWLIGYICFDYDLITELPADLGSEIVFPVIGFAASLLISYFKKKKIIRKYQDTDTFSLSDKDRTQIQNLNGENARIAGKYDKNLAVKTENGIFVCEKDKKVLSYLGIPYAKAPVGELRWKAPVKADSCNDVFEAKFFGPSAVQDIVDNNPLSGHKQSEDCLYLNIWVTSGKKSSEKKKVLFYIPGGDFSYGGPATPLCHGKQYVAAHPDTIFVSVGYRLGVFGFVDFSRIPGGEDYPDALNLGILDQIAALEWVNRNISAFGGDPDNITLMGDSAGATSLELIAACPRASGLFRRAIAITCSPEDTQPGAEVSQKLGESLAKEFSASTMQDLVKVPTDAFRDFMKKNSLLLSGPVRDGILFPKDLYGAYSGGQTGDVAFLFGLSKNELKSYESGIGGNLPSEYIHAYIERILAASSPEKAAAIRSIIEKKAETLSPAEADRWFANAWYNTVGILHLAGCLKNAGKSVRCFYWDSSVILEKLGNGTLQIISTILGNEEAAESYGVLINGNIQQILRALIDRFTWGKVPELHRNELKGVDAVLWEEYPQILSVTDESICCRDDFAGEETRDLLELARIAAM